MNEPQIPYPNWFNPIGFSVYRVAKSSKPGRKITFTSKSGHLIIERYKNYISVRTRIFDKVSESMPSNEVDITTNMTYSVFRYAFDLKDKGEIQANWIHESIPSQIGEKLVFGQYGTFIRDGQFLNIRNPGTGKPGDSNFSLHLRPPLQKRLVEFLEQSEVT